MRSELAATEPPDGRTNGVPTAHASCCRAIRPNGTLALLKDYLTSSINVAPFALLSFTGTLSSLLPVHQSPAPFLDRQTATR